MIHPTPEQLERLPKWAQEHIHFLTRRLAESEAAFKEATVSAGPDSAIIINPYSDHLFALTGRPNIAYNVHVPRTNPEQGWTPRGTFHIRHMGGMLDINYSADRGSTGMHILPYAANVIRISPEPR